MVILFDLDGTLTDSGEGITKCAQLALDHFGIHIENRTQLRCFVGPPLRESFPKFGVPEDRVEEAITVFRSRYLTVGKFENVPYPGIENLLRTLKAQGIAYLLELEGRGQKTVMVGDTAFDVVGAAAHGIPTIGVSWGYGDVDEMRKAGACAIAHSPEELETLLGQE